MNIQKISIGLSQLNGNLGNSDTVSLKNPVEFDTISLRTGKSGGIFKGNMEEIFILAC